MQILRDGKSVTLMPGAGDAKLSPDGRQLIFYAPGARTAGLPSLYISDSVGSGLRLLVQPSISVGGFADWSADGQFIAFNDTVITSCA